MLAERIAEDKFVGYFLDALRPEEEGQFANTVAQLTERATAWRADKASIQQTSIRQLKDSLAVALESATSPQQSDAKMLLLLNQQIEQAQKDAAEKEHLLEGVDEELDQMTDRCKEANGRLGWWIMFVRALTWIMWQRTTRNRMDLARELIAERERLKKKGVELEVSLEDMQAQ